MRAGHTKDGFDTEPLHISNKQLADGDLHVITRVLIFALL
jgi:hypothetical protein